jgi:hypothetical protein
MNLRWSLAFRCCLVGGSPESLTVSLSFEAKSIRIRVQPKKAGETVPIPNATDDLRFLVEFSALDFVAEPVNEAGKEHLDKLLVPSAGLELLRFVAKASNRVLRAARNQGGLAGVSEIGPVESDPEWQLRDWRVEVSQDGVVWGPVVQPPRELWEMFRGPRGNLAFPILLSGKWPLVEEAVLEDCAPPPELEFTVNAMEHLSYGNYRLALLEAIIGLELVLAEFLRKSLRRKGIPDDQAKDFGLVQKGPICGNRYSRGV